MLINPDVSRYQQKVLDTQDASVATVALGGRSTTASNSPMLGDYLAAGDEGEEMWMCNELIQHGRKKENQHGENRTVL